MFSSRPADLQAILDRPRPSRWQKFWAAPYVFIAQQLYAVTRPATPPQPIIKPVKVVCISDTHNSQPKEIPDGDVLIHAGDLTQSGSFKELQQTIDWIRSQPHPHKIVVAGNHDLLLDDSLDHRLLYRHDTRKREELDWGDIVYLQDSSTTVTCFNGRELQVYGSPRSPKHGNWAFQYTRSNDVWKGAVPGGMDILITHGPPRAHLDLLNLGCTQLLDEVWRVRPSLHVYGHVHEGYGQGWLQYDGLQRAFERIVIARGGLLNLLRVVHEALRWCWTPIQEPQTLLVNPSMVGGLRDDQRRQPIVVTI
ncbi:Metallo-dependent phosphatase [Fusarium austroafricanum]|uniref:Metallo-dependent phosphatase n=1 Tax=Fusarium austroafricanum TaxID=2364996 RepID=A0A8H4P4B1_9HYPO|nr:Metallo-dependent phosphatase [Fusarium austroafricanum]